MGLQKYMLKVLYFHRLLTHMLLLDKEWIIAIVQQRLFQWIFGIHLELLLDILLLVHEEVYDYQYLN